MLKDGQRSCAVCSVPIDSEEQYVVLTIPKDKAAPFLALTQGEPDLARRVREDSQGDLRLEVCAACHLHITALSMDTTQ
jgi:hypothetical protein